MWDPLFLSSIVNAPRQLADGAPHHLRERFRGVLATGHFRWHFVAHHLAHAASAFHASPFERAAVLTLDGRGERATTGYAIGQGTDLEWLGQVQMPHSLGMLYEQVTYYLGFLHSSDEYKVMALASFGKPRFASEFLAMVQLGHDGRYTIDPPRLEEQFGPARLRGGPLEQRHFDIAPFASGRPGRDRAGAGAVAATRLLAVDDLCLAGGVALNCVINARLRDKGPFRDIWVQPAAGDAGTALGAAVWIDAGERRGRSGLPYMDHAFLGPAYGDAEIESFLRWSKLPYRRPANVAEEAAAILAAGPGDRLVPGANGVRSQGPGARSILASPLRAEMQARLNEIKDREDFRPVAPVVLEEEAPSGSSAPRVSPFMLFVFDVAARQGRPDPGRPPYRRHGANPDDQPRPEPALLRPPQGLPGPTGVPVLVNTSFNTRGEPIVCTPRDAVE